MGLLTLPFRLPLMPVQGVIRLGEVIRDEAERQVHDPARVRRELEETEEARRRGEISDSELARAEDEAIERLVGQGGNQNA